MEPAIPLPTKLIRKRTENRSAYFRVQDRALLPSLKDTDLVFLDGPFLQYAPQETAPLTLIPPSMYGPPEKVAMDMMDTQVPGLLLTGNLAFLPWDLGALYHRHSSPPHAKMVDDLLRKMQPKRQLLTNAHPLVEISVMQQPALKRTVVHFVNLSGHSSTAYHAPVEMRDIQVDLLGKFTSIRTGDGTQLGARPADDYTRFILPTLRQYEAVTLE